jgi:tetratricopeptide (TPR) repeat protein
MPLSLPGLLLVIVIAFGATQGQAQPKAAQAPIPVSPGTSSFDDRSASASPYLDLVERYRAAVASGDDDAHMKAIEALKWLPNGHSLDHAIREFDRLALRKGGDTNPGRLSGSRLTMLADAWDEVLPCAAVMHLETAYLLFQENEDDRAMSHLSIARSIVGWQPWVLVTRLRPDIGARHESLRRDIYTGITWTLQTYRRLHALQQHLAKARQEFPDDAMVRLALGSLEELRATAVELAEVRRPTSIMKMPVATWLRLAQKEHWDKAIDHYRAALSGDASLAEARLRLGRVLRLRGQLKDARRELEAAATSARGSAPSPMPTYGPAIVMPYLSAMFLAEVIEEEGGAREALTRYQEIVRQWPSCQSGLLALGRAYEAHGDRDAALKVLQPLAREQEKRWCVDPWWTYNLGQGWRFGPFIRSVRIRAVTPS